MNVPRAGRERPWRKLMVAVLVFVLVLLAIALWSEREDSLRAPQQELEEVETAPG